MSVVLAEDRALIRISGDDRIAFLQGLVTNDARRIAPGQAVYAALLTPQGKYLADFLMVADGDAVLLDADAAQAPGLIRRLSMYKLRSRVEIAADSRRVALFLNEPAPEGALWAADPRSAALGLRAYLDGPTADSLRVRAEPADAYDRIRISACIPAAGRDLTPDDSYILENNFDHIGGVNYRKGCYVGQEIVARMKHKAVLRKGLLRVALSGCVCEGDELFDESGKSAGRLGSVCGDVGLALLRLDRAEGALRAASGGTAIAFDHGAA